MIVQVADGVREAELRSIPAVQAVERLRDGCYHLKVAGSIDLVIKALARHTVQRLEVEEAPMEEVLSALLLRRLGRSTRGRGGRRPRRGVASMMGATATRPAPTATRARPRRRGIPVLTATLRGSRTLIGAACFYILIIGLLIGIIFPALTALDLRSYVSSTMVGALLGVSKLPSSNFEAYLAVELYSSFFLLLFGGVLAYASGASIARNIEDGTIDLTLARPVSRTRFYGAPESVRQPVVFVRRSHPLRSDPSSQ